VSIVHLTCDESVTKEGGRFKRKESHEHKIHATPHSSGRCTGGGRVRDREQGGPGMGEHDATRRVPSCCGCCGSREAGTSARGAGPWTASGQSGAEEKHVHGHAGWLCAACASDSIQAKARRVAETRARCTAARERIESCLARLGQPTTRGERRPLTHGKREQRRAEMRATEEALEEALREARNRIAERRRRSEERRRQIELASEKVRDP